MLKSESNKLNVVVPGGLNQIYNNVSKKFVNYTQIFKYFLELLSADKDIIENINKHFSDRKFDSTHIPIDGSADIYKLCSDILKNEFKLSLEENSTIKEIIKEFDFIFVKNIIEPIISQNNQIIFLYDSPLDLYVDQLILKLASFDKYFIFKLKTNEFSNLVSESPKIYMFFDYDLSNLKNWSLMGCWTGYLSLYNFTSFYNCKETHPFYKTNVNNLKILKTDGNFFNFSVHTFYQLTNYYQLINETNLESKLNTADVNLFDQKFNLINPIKVLVYLKTIYKKGELRKAFHYTSNYNVFFIFHVGGVTDEINKEESDVDLSLNKKFEVILIKISVAQELENLSNLISKVESYSKQHPEVLIINNLDYLPHTLNREKMINSLNLFCNQEKVIETCKKFNYNLILPQSYSTALVDVYEESQLRKFMTENKLKLPLILKFSGPRTDFNHLLITIISEEGLKNYIEFIKEYSKGLEEQVSMILQTFVNHGGFVFKLYRADLKSFMYTRASLPDASEALCKQYEEYSRGFFQTYTNELLSEKYLNFWKHLSNDEKVNGMIDRNFLNEIAIHFEKFSKMTLFGLDFLFDTEKKEYSLIDVNFHPGYKELINDFNSILTDHIDNYYSIFKEKGHIFEY